MGIILTSILSVLLAILGIYFTIRYSTKYHIRGDKFYKERYEVLEKIAYGTKSGYIDSARIVLAKSSIDKAIGFMDVSLTTHPEEIHVDRYAFIHSCTHVLFAPGKTILRKEKSWSEKTTSNQFEAFVIKSEKLDSIPVDLLPRKLKSSFSECRAVESSFEYPQTYTGPRYKKRLLILAKGVGIVFCRTEYMNGDIDTYRLRSSKIRNGNKFWLPVNNLGNYWVYDIECQFGPNMLNMSE